MTITSPAIGSSVTIDMTWSLAESIRSRVRDIGYNIATDLDGSRQIATFTFVGGLVRKPDDPPPKETEQGRTALTELLEGSGVHIRQAS